MSVTVIDFLVVGVILLSAVFAMWRGLVQETLSIFAWVAAAYSALRFYPLLEPLLKNYIASGWLASLAAGAIIFLLVLIPLSFLSHRFGENVKNSRNRPGGPRAGFCLRHWPRAGDHRHRLYCLCARWFPRAIILAG